MSGSVGQAIHDLARELAPICRSLTGDGVRATLDVIERHLPVPLGRVEVPTGTPVLDWEIPREWNLRRAYVATVDGEHVIDTNDSWLHAVGHSVPVRARLSRDELLPHLHSIPERPTWVPYRTAYFAERWGFCVTHERLESLPDGEFDVVVDATLEPGHLTYGELYLPGAREDEVLVSCHVCHPELANDGLAGMAVATYLARERAGRDRDLSYRFLFAPGTLGAIAWLALNEERLGRVCAGLVLACVGDPGRKTYKRSRRGASRVDRAVEHVLRHSGESFEIRDFSPYGYDERQFCSPGFDLPVGCLMRTPFEEYPEYHTSADNLDLIRPEALGDTFATCIEVFDLLERDGRFLNLSPKGEPRLGARGLYDSVGGGGRSAHELALLWVLNMSDGSSSLLDIADRSGLSFPEIREAADRLVEAGLLADAGEES